MRSFLLSLLVVVPAAASAADRAEVPVMPASCRARNLNELKAAYPPANADIETLLRHAILTMLGKKRVPLIDIVCHPAP